MLEIVVLAALAAGWFLGSLLRRRETNSDVKEQR